MSGYKRYPKYRDSGVEWIGEVPEGWETLKIKRLANLRSGEMIGPDRISQTGNYPVFGGNGLRGYTDSYTHNGDYALIGRQGALCGNINYARGKFWASEHAVVITCVRDVNTHWFGEMLRAANLNQYSTSAAQPGLSVEIISNLYTAAPPPAEQTAIATYLDRATARIDALVAKKTRFIALLKEKRQALITHAVTKGLNPNAKMKDSGVEWIGEVPEGWDVIRLGAVYREIARAGDQDLPVLSISIHDGITDEELAPEDRDRQVYLIKDRTKYKLVRPNDLAYNMMRAWQGAFGAVAVRGLVSPAYVVAEPLVPLNSGYIESLLRTPMAVEEMRRFSHGVADFRMRLYWEYFRDLWVCFPPLVEQNAIALYLDRITARIDKLVSLVERSIALLQEKRSALITAAVTGKILVGDGV